MPLIDTNGLETGERLPGWKGRTFSSEKMTFAHFTFEAGSRIHEHSHPNEEVWTVIEGELEVSVGGDSMVAKPGFVAIVPPNTAHSVTALTNGKAIVADCPVRTDASGGQRGVVRVQIDNPISLSQEIAQSDIQIPFRLSNSGKTRAVVREVRVESNIDKSLPPPTTTEIPEGDLPTYCALEANQEYSGTIWHPGLAPEESKQLMEGQLVFYIKGAVFYDDDFGHRQHSTFCRVYDPAAFDRRGGFVEPDRPGYNYGS
ncbi:MAG TPA: cupin domain-containing protein [Blastocatellia bacterium]|nr:cupin domain-containing protein [Blastocatellia bacterium]